MTVSFGDADRTLLSELDDHLTVMAPFSFGSVERGRQGGTAEIVGHHAGLWIGGVGTPASPRISVTFDGGIKVNSGIIFRALILNGPNLIDLLGSPGKMIPGSVLSEDR